MKKTLNVNLNGSVFTIDEDAYTLLENYLNNLRIYFRKEEGASDIIADFEARIEELFSEKTRLGYQVITFEHVEEVIARVGRPADFADRDEKEAEQQTNFAEPEKVKKKFYRNVDEKLLGGVCSGIAAYFDWNTAAVRIVLALLPFVFSSLGVFTIIHPIFIGSNSLAGWIILAYIIAWIVVPGAHTAEQKLQMRGKPITVENIGKTVAAQSASVAPKEPKGCLAGFVDLIVAFIKVAMVGLGCLIGVPLLFALFIVIIVLIAVIFGVGGSLFGVLPAFLVVEHPVLATVTGVLVLGIPVVALVYVIIAHFTKAKPMNQPVKWTILLIWILALVLFLFSGLRVDGNRWFDRWDHSRFWNKSVFYDRQEIRGNNIPSQKTIDFDEAITRLEVGRYLNANLQIEQSWDETNSIEITGDENLVEQVNYNLQEGRLTLSSKNRLRNNNNLKITIRASALKNIQVNYIGKIRMDRAFTGEALEIEMKGIGSFHADSLYVNSLIVRSEGVGSINLSGKADHTRLVAAGTGKIDAMELLSDTVYAQVDGVGAIQCNPVEYLNGNLSGVGSITYKEEPNNKDVSSSGIGKIKRR